MQEYCMKGSAKRQAKDAKPMTISETTFQQQRIYAPVCTINMLE